MTATLEQPGAFVEPRVSSAPDRRVSALEVLALIAAPVVLYYGLRLRGMAPPGLPDPAMHTTYIIDPHDIFQRYEALFTPTARLREAARVGFLVPARLTYLAFGALPGFFVYRYLLALVAIVPAYLLMKRLYGRWAGWLAVVVVMSSPVVITAWGTDYPDSAALSYLTGGLAALALWWHIERRWRWLVLAGALLTFALWSHGVAVPLTAASLMAFVATRLWEGRTAVRGELPALARDLAVLAASGLVVTGLLALGSGLLLGQFDFIGPTIQSAKELTRPEYLHANHSASWAWAPYVNYLLVPPAVVLAFVIVFARRSAIAPARLFIGLAGLLQLAILAYLQFLSSLQSLEMHYFSSMLWSSVNLVLVVVLAEMARPALGRWAHGAAPALMVVAIALGYEALVKLGVSPPAMKWVPGGALLVAAVAGGAVLARLASRRALVGAASIIAVAGASLVLTVAHSPPHRLAAPTVTFDPIPEYSAALGGSDARYVAEYRVISRLPGFVGPAAYKGEVLLTWAPPPQFPALQGPLGIFHNAFPLVNWKFPALRDDGARKIEQWRGAQVLLMSLTGQDFARAVQALGPFRPVVVRRGVISDGWYHLHVWLVDLRTYIHPASV